MIGRLRHYFLTYKQAPQSDEGTKTEITHMYGREEAYEVIRRAHNDFIAYLPKGGSIGTF